MRQGFRAVGLACALFMMVGGAQAATWNVVELGVWPGQTPEEATSFVQAQALNEAGQVAGLYFDAQGRRRVFLTGPDGSGFQDLGLSFATPHAVNAAGQVAGEIQVPDGTGGFPTFAFVTGPAGQGLNNLGQLPGRGFASARDINDAGQVVGASGGDGFVLHTQAPGGASLSDGRGLTVVPNASVTALDDTGRMVGTLRESNGSVGFVSGLDGTGLRRLETPGWTLLPAALSDTGWIAGGAFADIRTDDNAFDEAFLMAADGTGPIFIGSGVARWSTAFGVNRFGQVVGVMVPNQTLVIERAFITGAGGEGFVDLNSEVVLANGALLTRALDINDLGQVIAQDNQGRSWLLSPVPEPSAALLMAAGLCAVAGLARRSPSRTPALA